jgi:hypothetical protein
VVSDNEQREARGTDRRKHKRADGSQQARVHAPVGERTITDSWPDDRSHAAGCVRWSHRRVGGRPEAAAERRLDRALIGAPHQKPRPQLAHIIVEDLLAASIAQLPRQARAAASRESADQPAAAPRSTASADRASTPPTVAHNAAARRCEARTRSSRGEDRSGGESLGSRAVRPDASALISAPRSTPITHSSSPGPTGPSEGQDPTGRSGPPRRGGGSVFDRRSTWTSIQAAPTALTDSRLRNNGSTVVVTARIRRARCRQVSPPIAQRPADDVGEDVEIHR